MSITLTNTLQSASRVEVEKYYEDGVNYIQFTFPAKLTEDTAREAVAEWDGICRRNPGRKFTYIWNCSGMTGFENGAKRLWLDYLEKHDEQTSRIVIISDNIIVRGAARIMSKMMRQDLQVVKNYSELYQSGIKI